jgi:hypothetical protein
VAEELALKITNYFHQVLLHLEAASMRLFAKSYD